MGVIRREIFPDEDDYLDKEDLKLIEQVQERFAQYNIQHSGERIVQFIDVCMTGYCEYCGSKCLPCYCLCDD